MLDVIQFRARVVRPTLQAIGHHSQSAENLILGTGVQESRLRYLVQLRQGPARGLFQMEPATHDDIWDNYLAHRAELRARVQDLLVPSQDRVDQLIWNLAYATANCRAHYLRVPTAVPAANDIDGLGAYWKAHYNTELGQGTAAEFVENYERYVVQTGTDT